MIYDGGALVASAGRLLAQGPRFSFLPRYLTSAVVDVSATRMGHARVGSFQPTLTDQTDGLVECMLVWPEIEPQVPSLKTAAWEASPQLKEEEFTRAITLGLFDYMRKSRSHGFVVSTSGGADSSAVACLVSLMIEIAYEELGPQGFCNVLSYIPGLSGCSTHHDRVRRLLHCVYQASANSSRQTQDAATAVVRRIGGEMSHLAIDQFVQGYVEGIERVLGRRLTWETDDLALQNIQARVRAPSVWLLANVKHALLLATSNRSEAAVGYATMDGDTAGGLSPIAGIDKAFLRMWLRWLQIEGPAGVHPIPALSAVNDLAPTAELRPLAACQTDEADLMPYPVLDAIERAAVRDKQSPVEVFRLMRSIPRVRRGRSAHLDCPFLPIVVPESMEAGAICSILSRGRRRPGSAELVPLPHPVRRLRKRIRGTEGIRRWFSESAAGWCALSNEGYGKPTTVLLTLRVMCSPSRGA